MKIADLSTSLQQLLDAEIKSHKLPGSFKGSLERGILPTARYIAEQKAEATDIKAPIWGICGAQGTGKSTLVHFLSLCLKHIYNLSSTYISIDDFYLSREERQRLSVSVHPLLATRGAPGTHNVMLGTDTLHQLQHLKTQQQPVPLPAFNKATDDIIPSARWSVLSEPVDLILFEGWCVGTPPQPPSDLHNPCNHLERTEDAEGIWRAYANDRLRTDYANWYSLLDRLIFLRVPDFEQVREWRSLQEEKLRQSYTDRGLEVPDKIMSADQVARFIQHYERLTRWNLDVLPTKANVVLELLKDHSIASAQFQSSA